MTPELPLQNQIRRELVKSIALQIARALLWVQVGRLVAKGYLTSGQAEYILIGIVSLAVAVSNVVITSVLRYARAQALRHLPADSTPQDVRQLTWEIVGKLLNLDTSKETL